ncbi:vesicle transport through interaction with t-SNAREs protein 1A [Danaus plexippus plexippus]|uniref:Vesicle transport through interaction with t-SNAREs protein 1A n=1 Tax=Danaus plexippus plexippus TaxID=278856 RepID=A0A212FK44_DANPL|nr:vesicle transport through interaction with t-SNAREs protein 1A [Danaus plexippus plexippus]
MSTLIQSYEQQYSILTAEITAKIGRLKTAHEDDRDQLSREIQSNFEEANDLLEQLELESRGSGGGSRVPAYRAELQRVRDEFRSALRETDEQLSRSGRLMNTMVTRALQQRAVLAAVLLVLVILAALGARQLTMSACEKYASNNARTRDVVKIGSVRNEEVKDEPLVHFLVYWLYIACSKVLPSGLRVWFVLRCLWAFLCHRYESLSG